MNNRVFQTVMGLVAVALAAVIFLGGCPARPAIPAKPVPKAEAVDDVVNKAVAKALDEYKKTHPEHPAPDRPASTPVPLPFSEPKPASSSLIDDALAMARAGSRRLHEIAHAPEPEPKPSVATPEAITKEAEEDAIEEQVRISELVREGKMKTHEAQTNVDNFAWMLRTNTPVPAGTRSEWAHSLRDWKEKLNQHKEELSSANAMLAKFNASRRK